MDTFHNYIYNKGSSEPNNAPSQSNSTELTEIKSLSSQFINSIFEGIPLTDYLNQTSEANPQKEKQAQTNKTKSKHPKTGSSSLTQSNTPISPSAKHLAKAKSPHSRCNLGQIRMISFNPKGKDNKPLANNNDSLNSMTESVIETYKVSAETEKKRKQYEDKAKAMQNRLNALKKQEELLMKKMNVFQSKEKEMSSIKNEKVVFKNALNSIKAKNNKRLEEQQRRNNQLKDEVQKGIRESLSQIKIKKQTEYELARTEKQMVTAMINENMEQIDTYNQMIIEKIKSEHERHKEEELRKQKENEQKMKKYYIEKSNQDAFKADQLKAQIEEMERMEEKYLHSLRTSQKKKEMIKGPLSYYVNKGNSLSNKITVNVTVDEKYNKKDIGNSSVKNSIDYANNNTLDNEKMISQRFKNMTTSKAKTKTKVGKGTNSKATKLSKKWYSIDQSVEIAYNDKGTVMKKTIHRRKGNGSTNATKSVNNMTHKEI